MKKPKNQKTLLCYSMLLILTLISASCGRLSQNTAHEAFLKEHPTYTIISSGTGEGWEGVAYHHFAYKKPNDDTVYAEIWCFEQQDDGTWEVTARWTPKE